MNYIIYIDVYFFVNFLMNILFLCLLSKVEGKNFAKRKAFLRIMLGAFVGGLLSVFFIVVSYKVSVIVRFFIIHGILGYFMIRISFHYKTIRQRLQALIKLSWIEIIVSGILNMIVNEEKFLRAKTSNIQVIENNSIYQIVGVGTFTAVLLGQFFCNYKRERYKRSHLYPLKLTYHERQCEGIGLLDTGNHLREPISKQAVIIATLEALKGFLEEDMLSVIENIESIKDTETMYRLKWIPYHSLGRKNGFLAGIIIDELIIYQEGEEIVHKKPLIAITKEELSQEGSDTTE